MFGLKLGFGDPKLNILALLKPPYSNPYIAYGYEGIVRCCVRCLIHGPKAGAALHLSLTVRASLAAACQACMRAIAEACVGTNARTLLIRETFSHCYALLLLLLLPLLLLLLPCYNCYCHYYYYYYYYYHYYYYYYYYNKGAQGGGGVIVSFEPQTPNLK